MAQRIQLKNTPIRICEVISPGVHAALQREREDSDDNNSAKPTAITIEDFIKQITKAWENEQDSVTAGAGNVIVAKWYGTFGAQYEKAAAMRLGKKNAQ